MIERMKLSAGASRLFLALLAVLALLAAVLIGIPKFMKARSTASKTSCIYLLFEIEGAKEQWALENKKSAGTPTVASEVDAYILRGAPKCPAGGTYTYGAVGEVPKCSTARSMRGHKF